MIDIITYYLSLNLTYILFIVLLLKGTGALPNFFYSDAFTRIIAWLTLIYFIFRQFEDTATISDSIWYSIILSSVSLAVTFYLFHTLILKKTRYNPLIVTFDLLIYMAVVILIYTLIYRIHGIENSSGEPVDASEVLIHLYFSIVTFTTLGYGDYAPVDFSQLFAGIQAILGTLFLGLLIGLIFYAANAQQNSEK